VIPTHFGMVLESDEAVAYRLLETNAPALHDRCSGLRGQVAAHGQRRLRRGPPAARVAENDPAIAGLREPVRGRATRRASSTACAKFSPTRGNVEPPALLVGLWPPMFWLIGESLGRLE